MFPAVLPSKIPAQAETEACRPSLQSPQVHPPAVRPGEGALPGLAILREAALVEAPVGPGHPAVAVHLPRTAAERRTGAAERNDVGARGHLEKCFAGAGGKR